ncbi:MAG TPA: YraN family protein [Candidatus Megaira endosymbiont of Hartmannula sinica]|nr:YraN family protein [Candidatus Megaera endosymbiont of Hartmannula sinica]
MLNVFDKQLIGIKNYNNGLIAERVVYRDYRKNGYSFVKHRLLNSIGEIDLLFLKNKTLVFIEVKYSIHSERAYHMINDKKQQKLREAANLYLMENKKTYNNFEIRFDVAITCGKNFDLTIYNNVFI